MCLDTSSSPKIQWEFHTILACNLIYKVLLHEPEHARSQLANDALVLVFAYFEPLISKNENLTNGALAPVACFESSWAVLKCIFKHRSR